MSLLGRLSVVGAGKPPGPLDADGLLRLAAVERTLPVVARNLGVPCDMERTILARQMLAAHQASEIREKIEVLPLKGLYLARHVYPSPGLRDMGDIDLLVRRAHVGRADEALRSLGYASDFDPRRIAAAGDDYLNAVPYRREGAMQLHLHWHVSNASLPHFMYRIDMDEIWREAREGAMARHHLLITLCEHALKHSYDTLLHLTDIEQVARDADWPRVAATARRWGLERAVHYALVLVRDLMEVESPGLRFLRGSPLGWEGALFLRLARIRRWNGLSALGFLSLARGAGDQARFVREALSPPRRASADFNSRSMGRRLKRAAEMIWTGITP